MTAATTTCPMHPEVLEDGPGTCPICGMALEATTPVLETADHRWTCPMHPEVVENGPGTCPICGMALEASVVTSQEAEDPELQLMSHRFWIALVFTLPVFALAMSEMLPGDPLQRALPSSYRAWLQLLLASPVVLYGGWPFFQRGWSSLVSRHLNMFTLIAMGTGAAYAYSVLATLIPGVFPAAFRNADGSAQTNLTNNPARDEYPAWSPDGSKIAFQSNRDGGPRIYVMNADGSGQTKLTNQGDEYPAWSPEM